MIKYLRDVNTRTGWRKVRVLETKGRSVTVIPLTRDCAERTNRPFTVDAKCLRESVPMERKPLVRTEDE